MNASTEQKQIAAAASAVAGAVEAIAETIRELGSVPSGHLYARLMGHMRLESYEAIIGVLIRAGIVRREPSHLLVWVGNTLQSNRVPDASIGQQIKSDR